MKDSFDYVVIGAGISGIVISERLANLNNKKILIIDKRDHIGGNAYDFFNADGVLVHKYGPHIFHTSKEMVYKYLSAFTKWTPYKHKVVANVNNKLLPIPINRDTINGFFDLDLKNEQDVKQFLDKKRDTTILSIKNSKDVILSKYGEELYDGFIKNYTKKQWDLYPEELDKKVLERIPVRYDSNPYYFDDKYQCMPESGYTHMFNKMLESKNITVLLKTDYKDVVKNLKYKALIVTSAVDEFFNYKLGRLRYRCVDFKFKTYDKKEFQSYGVVNYPNTYKFTRITEFTKITQQVIDKTTVCKEYPSWTGEKSYPVPTDKDRVILDKYHKEVSKLSNVFFLGRLGEYKYINMDQAVEGALDLHKRIKDLY